MVAIAVEEHTGVLVGICGLRASLGRATVGVLGRHDRCDLVLRGDDIALRHLAIVLDPVTSWLEGARAGYRVLDLRTTSGIYDESGRPLRSFRADGPAVLWCGGLVVFLLPLGDPSDWPDCADQAWDMLPQRVYLDECGAVRPRHAATSVIFRTPPPVLHTAALVTGDLAGTLDLEQPGHTAVLPVGCAALREGVFLGRYARCDVLESFDPTVSRVHAMMCELAGQLLLVDLASTHGVGTLGGPRSRIVELVDGAVVWIGRQTRLRWRVASDTCRPGTTSAPPSTRGFAEMTVAHALLSPALREDT